jgi:TRAP-type C4-dicarboxylate transport system substrate-binding protein
VTVYGAGELVPPFEVFDAVAEGTAQLGHGSPYFWQGKNTVFQFFSGVPFGLTAAEHSAWLYFGGAQELWDRAYEPFGVKGFYAGSSGPQAGGWFSRPIESLDDLRGLNMRIAGLGGEVMRRLGVNVVLLPPGEIFGALQAGTIDAAEWIGPWNDLAFGLYRTAKYYYMPAFHEFGPALELMVNAQAYEALDDDLKEIVKRAAMASATESLADFTYHNADSFRPLLDAGGGRAEDTGRTPSCGRSPSSRRSCWPNWPRRASLAGRPTTRSSPIAPRRTSTPAPATSACSRCAPSGSISVEAGEFGRVLHFETNFSAPSATRWSEDHWRASRTESPAGGLAGMGVHMIDLFTFLGGPAVRTLANARRQVLNVDLEDTTSALFDLASGATAYLGSLCAAPFTVTCNVYGTAANAFAHVDADELRVQPLGGALEARPLAPVDTLRADWRSSPRPAPGARLPRDTGRGDPHGGADGGDHRLGRRSGPRG